MIYKITESEQKVWQKVRENIGGVVYEWKHVINGYLYSLDEHIPTGHVSITSTFDIELQKYEATKILEVLTKEELKDFMVSFLEAPNPSGLHRVAPESKPSKLLMELTGWDRTTKGYGYYHDLWTKLQNNYL